MLHHCQLRFGGPSFVENQVPLLMLLPKERLTPAVG
jgi:hypothetical protein